MLVVGLGGIGREVARRAHGLGMRVIATRNSSREGPDYVEYVGLSDELLQTPAIWLCLGCQRCTEACSQTVSGYDIIRRLQLKAIEMGFVDPGFPLRLLSADRVIYPKFLDEIDTLIGLHRLKEYPEIVDEVCVERTI